MNIVIGILFTVIGLYYLIGLVNITYGILNASSHDVSDKALPVILGMSALLVVCTAIVITCCVV